MGDQNASVPYMLQICNYIKYKMFCVNLSRNNFNCWRFDWYNFFTLSTFKDADKIFGHFSFEASVATHFEKKNRTFIYLQSALNLGSNTTHLKKLKCVKFGSNSTHFEKLFQSVYINITSQVNFWRIYTHNITYKTINRIVV